MRSTTTKVFVSVAIAIVLITAVSLLLPEISADSKDFCFASYVDVEKDKTVVAANLPDILPKSASEICGSNNVEFDTYFAEFLFEPSDVATVRSKFTEVSGPTLAEAKAKMARVSWRAAPPDSKTFIYYHRMSEGIETLAVNEEIGKAYYLAESHDRPSS